MRQPAVVEDYSSASGKAAHEKFQAGFLTRGSLGQCRNPVFHIAAVKSQREQAYICDD